MSEVARVYCHITGDRISKINTVADQVKAAADDYYEEMQRELSYTLIFYIACPECGEHAPYVWTNIQWQSGEPESARYRCAHCTLTWSDDQRESIVSSGYFRIPERGMHGSFVINAGHMYKPETTLASMVSFHEEAQRDKGMMKKFISEWLGYEWVNEEGVL
jgi:DNA-directed RNA polymerase subunit M/transcription elongation factor TFIIS